MVENNELTKNFFEEMYKEFESQKSLFESYKRVRKMASIK